MTGRQALHVADLALALVAVNFVVVVFVALLRRRYWLWPSWTVIGLAALASVINLTRFVLSGNLSAAVGAVAWLVMAAAFAATRWWLRRQVRRVAALLTHPAWNLPPARPEDRR